jgi:Tat protein secretion system quality control protein TatD with DNase activity
MDNNKDSQMERCINWSWLIDLETHLSEHPRLIIGEIGLCKMAQFVREFTKDKGGKAAALQLQKPVFSRQLQLAARWSRPVTVHCVD